VLAAQQRADDAEVQLQMMSQQSETRSVGLELRLSELSETFGNVERLRQQDQQIIQKLRERLVQVCHYLLLALLLVVIVLVGLTLKRGRSQPLNRKRAILKSVFFGIIVLNQFVRYLHCTVLSYLLIGV